MMHRPMRTVRALGLIATAALLLGSSGDQPIPEITAEELMEAVKFLADDDLEGRAAGSPGCLAAGEYIAAQFEKLGLKPAADEGTYFQNFSLPRGFEALPDTVLAADIKGREYTLKFERDIYPLPCSASGKAEGEVVFAGYGISASDLGYDDYEGVDVTGKIVVVLRGVPNGKSSKNPFKTAQLSRRYGAFRAKLDLAAGLGAAAIVVVNDPVNHAKKVDDKLVTTASGEQGKIPGIQTTYAAGGRLFSKAGLSLSRTQKALDATLKPRSKLLDKVRITLNSALAVKNLKVRNVAGLLEATSPDKKDEVLVIGAHFDHVGLGEFGSLGGSKAKGEVHNGADDNASGTAAVIELAEWFVPQVQELKRDVLFICFTAEEMGLLGSKHYVDAPLIPIHKTAAMINLDMISYLKTTKHLEIYGTATSPSFEDLLKQANRETRIKLKPIDGVGRGASDHYPFYKKGMPVLFFITGLHKNYHRPSDDWQKCDRSGFEKVVIFAGLIAEAIAKADNRPIFKPTTEGGLETGPYLGVTIEDRDGGIFVAEVAKKSPADRGGLEEDDRVVEVDDKEVGTTAMFYGIWAAVEPGKKVSFLISRSGRQKTVRVQLEK